MLRIFVYEYVPAETSRNELYLTFVCTQICHFPRTLRHMILAYCIYCVLEPLQFCRETCDILQGCLERSDCVQYLRQFSCRTARTTLNSLTYKCKASGARTFCVFLQVCAPADSIYFWNVQILCSC
jgi:hypothetical protein